MRLPRLAVNRPITTSMVLVTILVLGGIAFSKIPLAYLPEVDVPFIMVQVPYPNSNPTQIERDITKPVEEILSTLSGVKKLNSASRIDGADFFMEFDWGQDLDVVRMQVSEKIEQVKPELPAGIGEILIFSFNTTDIPVVQSRISAKGVDLSESYELIEARILNRLRRIPGVARVTLDGVEAPEIFIDLVLDRVKQHNVDVGRLIQLLRGTSTNVVLGQVETGGLRFSARALAGFRSVEEIGSLIVNDQGLRLADIAEITYEEPPIPHGRHLDRSYAVAVEVFKESTANTVDVVRQVMSVIRTDIDADPLLQGIELFVWEDQAEEITNSIRGLTKAGSIGELLAVLCLYLFLRRFDSTFIVSLSIPFSVIASCGILFFMGKTLNLLSMMGLMLGVGMLVDNAVVVLESIDRVHRTERDPRRAATEGSRAVAMAVTASTTTSLIVFLPLIVGANTELTTWLKEVGIAISVALVCSLFSALTLIPLMSAHFLKRKRTRPVAWIERLEDRYARILAWTMRHRVATLFSLLGLLGLGMVPFASGLVKSAIFAAHINERLFLRYEFADFTYKSDAERAVDQVEAFLDGKREEFLVGSLYSFFRENEAFTAINLSRQDLDDDEIKELRGKIREELPEIAGARLFFDEDSDEGGSSTYFTVKFFGQDTGVLEDYADEAARRLETVAGVLDVRTSLRGSRREVRVSVDREKARRVGLTARDVSDIFTFTLGGMRLDRFKAGEKEIESWLALRLEDRESLEDLKQISLGSPTGRPVLLGDIASFEVVPRPNEIERENRKVRVSVDATYEGEEWDKAKKEIEGLMNAFDFPPGYSWGWNDRIIEQEDENQQMAINFLLALLLVYIVMASLFESLAQPFSILFSIPFALPGVAWTLAATRTPFNLMAQIGLLILMGVVVNNGIVLLDHMNQLRRGGLSTHEAILQAGRERLRPILMTALTTVVGLIPLAIGGSKVGGLFYFPLARTLMGGLLSSTLLTLVVLPYVNLGV